MEPSVEADMKTAVVEAAAWVEAAIEAAQSLAKHGIIPSYDYERMMGFMVEAAETLRRAKLKGEGQPSA